jgi:hypothetical protein
MSIPIVRLTIEGMKHEILTALTEQTLELDGQVKAAVEHVVRGFNVEAEIQEVTAKILRDAIQDAVSRVVHVITWDDDIRALIREKVLQALKANP